MLEREIFKAPPLLNPELQKVVRCSKSRLVPFQMFLRDYFLNLTFFEDSYVLSNVPYVIQYFSWDLRVFPTRDRPKWSTLASMFLERSNVPRVCSQCSQVLPTLGDVMGDNFLSNNEFSLTVIKCQTPKNCFPLKHFLIELQTGSPFWAEFKFLALG